MTLESALAGLVRSRPDDLADVVEELCALAEYAQVVGDLQRRDDTLDVAAQLIAHGAQASVSA